MRHGFLVYAERLGGWIFPDRPLRRARQPWRSENHTGEPYVWTHDCPFCGRVMER